MYGHGLGVSLGVFPGGSFRRSPGRLLDGLLEALLEGLLDGLLVGLLDLEALLEGLRAGLLVGILDGLLEGLWKVWQTICVGGLVTLSFSVSSFCVASF